MTTSKQMKDVRILLDTSLDHYRAVLHGCLNGLSEEEARRSLLPSKTTLLGLVKHVTFVEKFYFEHAVTGRSLKDIGVAATPDRSFVLRKADTIESIQHTHRIACQESRQIAATLELDEIVAGKVEQPVLTIYLSTLHDLIHHCGHADILREQILAAR